MPGDGERMVLFRVPQFWRNDVSSPVVEYPIVGQLVVRFDTDATDPAHVARIWFDGVKAARQTGESVSLGWHVEQAVECLVEISGSSWVLEAEKLLQARAYRTAELHHYLMYFDGVGCYEVLAESWRVEQLE